MATANIERYVALVLGDGTIVDSQNGLPTTGGGGGGGAVTMASGAVASGAYAAGSIAAGAYVSGALVDGAIVTLGALADAAVGDATGSVNAHARQIAKLLGAPLAVSQSGTWTVGLSAGVAAIGSVSVSNFPATQPVSGTVTANAGSGTFAMQATAGSPGSVELSDGAAFYVGAKTGQLPAALVSGRLDVNVGAALPAGSNSIGTVVLGAGAAAVGTVTANAGSGTFSIQATAAAPGAVQLSDGSAFYVGAKTGQLPAALVSSRLDVNLGKAPGTISSVNSSTATLLANAVFTGTSEDVSSFALIEVSVFADQVSAAGGLSLQFSSDGTHWDLTQAVTISASAGAMFALCPCAEFFRLVYTNGAVNQGAFRLQTLYRPVSAPQTQATFQDVNAALSPTGIAQRVAADLVIQNAAGNTSVRPRCASDNVAGVGGGSLLAAAGLVYDVGGSKFWPIQGTTGGQQFVQAQGIQASGAAVATNPVLTGGIDGTNVRYFLTDASGRQIAVGAAAAGAAVAGNPLLGGVSDGTNAQNSRQVLASAGGIVNGVGIPAAGLYINVGGANWFPVGTASGFGVANAGNNIPLSHPHLSNGTNFDPTRNNTTTVVQASTLTTAQTINTDIINYNGRAFMAHANVTIYNGGSILMKLQMKDANGLFVDIPGATTGTVSTGADLLLNVGPTVWPANTATMFNLNFYLPRNIRLVTVIGTASVTFSQSYDLPAN